MGSKGLSRFNVDHTGGLIGYNLLYLRKGIPMSNSSISLSILSDHLLNKLRPLYDIVPTGRSVYPITENFLFDLSPDGVVTVTASNAKNFVATKMEVQTYQGHGQFMFPAKMLMSTLKRLPPQLLDIRANGNTYGVTLECSTGSYQLCGANPAGFFDVPQAQALERYAIPASNLTKALRYTLAILGKDKIESDNPMLGGVNIKLDQQKGTFVSMDNTRLVYYEQDMVTPPEAVTLTLPTMPLKALLHFLEAEGKEVVHYQVDQAKGHIFFDIAGTTFIVKWMDGRYPVYDATLRAGKSASTMHISPKLWLGTLVRMQLYASTDPWHTMMVTIHATALDNKAEDINKAEERVACTFDGPPTTLKLNAKSLTEVVGVLHNEEEVQVKVGTPQQSIVFIPGSSEAGEKLEIYISPIYSPESTKA